MKPAATWHQAGPLSSSRMLVTDDGEIIGRVTYDGGGWQASWGILPLGEWTTRDRAMQEVEARRM